MGVIVKRGVALALLLLAASAAAFEPKKGKTRVSANGTFGIRVLELSEGSCRVEAVKEQELAWSLDKCVGGVDDLFFISDNGKRFWVLYPLPSLPENPSGKKKHSPLLEVVVAIEYDPRGNPLQTKRLGDFMGERSVEEVRPLGKHFKWLGGVLSVPGEPPRLGEAGEILFETVASKTHKLTF